MKSEAVEFNHVLVVNDDPDLFVNLVLFHWNVPFISGFTGFQMHRHHIGSGLKAVGVVVSEVIVRQKITYFDVASPDLNNCFLFLKLLFAVIAVKHVILLSR